MEKNGRGASTLKAENVSMHNSYVSLKVYVADILDVSA